MTMIVSDVPIRLQAIEAELKALREKVITKEEAINLATQVGNMVLARTEPGARNQAISLVGIEDRQWDMMRVLFGKSPVSQTVYEPLRIVTQYPVAISSADHTHPRGTKADNTRSPRFVARCEAVFGRKVSHMDLGCAGGGLVWDFHSGGNQSIGIEGSDYSLLERRAFWSLIPERLFTADITKPFRIETDGGQPKQFDVVTAWEVLEHIHEADLPAMFANIRDHLVPGGLFVASVATFPDQDPVTGAVWHVTIKPRAWWAEKIASLGLKVVETPPFTHHDYVRGTGNNRTWDWDAAVRPEMGFHIVAARPT